MRAPLALPYPAFRVGAKEADMKTERIDTVVVGGGQAGLSVGYHLKERGVQFVILDASSRIGDAWRNRWDSLHLFTPAKFSGLDGMRFPAPPNSFPSKDAMGEYLERYARHFQLPVRSGVRVERLSRLGDRFLVVAGEQRFEADNVVVAMSGWQRPRVPAFASELNPRIVQIHTFDYRNPSQLQPGGVVVVGAGNSGAEIALDVVPGHETWLAGPDTGHVPFRIEGLVARVLLVRLVLRVVFHRILTVKTPIGRKVRAKMLHHGEPLVRTKPQDLVAAGVKRVPRVVRIEGGLPVLEDGRKLDVSNVIWCTGFHSGFSWIDLPVFDANGDAQHDSGVVTGEPGLYFVGLKFLYAASSSAVHGVGRDAARIADRISATRRNADEARVPDPGAGAAARVA
jgi:putative flavoprotein involved in K+ transport